MMLLLFNAETSTRVIAIVLLLHLHTKESLVSPSPSSRLWRAAGVLSASFSGSSISRQLARCRCAPRGVGGEGGN